jgi:hypothetical protein
MKELPTVSYSPLNDLLLSEEAIGIAGEESYRSGTLSQALEDPGWRYHPQTRDRHGQPAMGVADLLTGQLF